MGFFKYFSATILFGSLVACGGGGSTGSSINTGFYGYNVKLDNTPDGPGSNYVGKITEANITNDNAEEIIELFFAEDYNDIAPEVGNRSETNNSITKQVSEQLSLFSQMKRSHQDTWHHFNHSTENNNKKQLRTQISESGNGSVSGSYSMTGNANDNGTGKVTINWNNYNNGDGVTINGASSYELALVYIDAQIQYVEEIDSIHTFQSLRLDYDNYHVLLNGEIKEHFDINSRATTYIYNTDVFHSGRNKWASNDNLKYNIKSGNYFSSAYEIQGRYYHEDVGYITLDTIETLVCDEYRCRDEFVPFLEGKIEIIGATDSSITLEGKGGMIVDNAIRSDNVSILVNNQEPIIHAWTAFDGVNEAPVITSLNFEGNIYHIYPDEALTFSYAAYDPDGDEVSTRIEWRRNNKLILNIQGNTLPVGYFRGGDEILVTLIASDGVLESSKTYRSIYSSSDEYSLQVKLEKILEDEKFSLYEKPREHYPDFRDALVEDINNDGFKDIILMPHRWSENKSIGVLYQRTHRKYEEIVLFDNLLPDFARGSGTYEYSSQNNPYFFDLNRDGLKDILFSGEGAGTDDSIELKYSLQKTDNTFGEIHKYVVDKRDREHIESLSFNNFIIRDLTNDGIPDLLVAYLVEYFSVESMTDIKQQKFKVLQFDQNAKSFGSREYSMPDNIASYKDMVVMDATQDGLNDIVVIQPEWDQTGIHVLSQATGFSHHQVNYLPNDDVYIHSNSEIIISDDLDGDGLTDLIIREYGTAPYKILKQQSSGGFKVENHTFITSDAANNSQSQDTFSTFDVNHDGRGDFLAYSKSHVNSVEVAVQNENGEFRQERQHRILNGYLDFLTVDDLDDDGKLDAITGENNSINIQYGREPLLFIGEE